ncbi:MAG TPA: M24 family metallopeptidase [Solirubrobacteraceae bacterium]|nr:M24 family metallopeptidase [Solirubrobacteraceae bacterium]
MSAHSPHCDRTPTPAPFTRGEYDARLRSVRERMEAQGLAALVVTDPANMHYLTGYDGWSFYTPQCVVVPADAEPLIFTRGMDAAGARLTTILDPSRIFGYPDDYVQRRDTHPMDWIAAELDRQGLNGGRVGVELDAYYFSARSHQALQAGLSKASFTDAEELVNWVRAVKSEAELAHMRVAARVAERAMTAAVDAIRSGVRQCDAAAAISSAQIRGTAEIGGDYPAIVPMLPTGAGTSTPHLTWSDAPFTSGEATLIELAGCYRRYHCPMARTVAVGPPAPRLVEVSKITVAGLEAALAAVRPGATCEDIEAAWRVEVGRHGLEKPSRMGYAVGLGYPPDWGEHTMSLRPGDKSVLEPGMTFHLIAGMWLEEGGFEVSEAFVVTEGGAECLSSFPRELQLKD